MAKTTTLIDTFEETVKKYSSPTKELDVKRVVSGIERVRGQNPAVYNERDIKDYLKERANVLSSLVDDYFTASMSTRFPVIDDCLFDLKRFLTVRKSSKNSYSVVRDDTELEKRAPGERKKRSDTVISVPLFAYTPLFNGKDPKVVLGKFSKIGGDGYQTKAQITATLPGSIGPNLKEVYRSAMSHYFGTLSGMFANPAASDIMYSEGDFTRPEVGAIWIPTPESLSVSVKRELIERRPNLDPAMVLTARGRKYLVQTWQVDDEEPFEHYLREFSSGSLEGKL